MKQHLQLSSRLHFCFFVIMTLFSSGLVAKLNKQLSKADFLSFIKFEQEQFRLEVQEFKALVRHDTSEVRTADCQIYAIILRNISFTEAYDLEISEFRRLLLKHKKTMLERKKQYQQALFELSPEYNVEDIDSFNSKGLSSFTDLWVQTFNLSMRTAASYVRVNGMHLDSLPLDAVINLGTSGLGLLLTMRSSANFIKRKAAEDKLKNKIKALKKQELEIQQEIDVFDVKREAPEYLAILQDELDEIKLDHKVLCDSLEVKREQIEAALKGLVIDGVLSSSSFVATVITLSGATGAAVGLATAIVGGLSCGVILAYLGTTKIITDVENLHMIDHAAMKLKNEYDKTFPPGQEQDQVTRVHELAYKLKINNLHRFHKTVRTLNLSRSSFLLATSSGIFASGAIGLSAALGVATLVLASAATGYAILGLAFVGFVCLASSYALEAYWGPRSKDFLRRHFLGTERGPFPAGEYYQHKQRIKKLEKNYKTMIHTFELDVKAFKRSVQIAVPLVQILSKLDEVYRITPKVYEIQLEMNRLSIEVIPYRVYFQAMDSVHRQMVEKLFHEIDTVDPENYDTLLDRLNLDKKMVDENPFGLTKKQMLEYMVGIWILSHYSV